MSARSTRMLAVAVALLGLGALAAGCGGSDDNSTTAASAGTTTQTMGDQPATVVAAAQATPDLSTLVKAVTAADLATTLSGSGPYTVFAPTNAAFDALPAGQLDQLLKPQNKKQLADILTYHVVQGEHPASSLKNGQELTTLEGGKLKVTVNGSKVEVNDVPVLTADVMTGNGVVHVIGGVLTPPGS